MSAVVFRGIGHPWTSHPGWDQMLLQADDGEPSTLQKMVDSAKEKFWAVWHQAGERAHLYKPAGATAPWQDVKWQGTPRGHALGWKVGDEVYTDFSGEITRHQVVEISASKLSPSGVRIRVKPPVPQSEFVGDDGKIYGTVFIDAGWFRRVEVQA